MAINYFQLLYGLHTGFLGQIKPNFRCVAVSYNTGSLKLNVYCDENPKDKNDDEEMVRSILSEAEAHIDGVSGMCYDIIYSNEQIKKLDSLDFWYFIRYDVN